MGWLETTKGGANLRFYFLLPKISLHIELQSLNKMQKQKTDRIHNRQKWCWKAGSRKDRISVSYWLICRSLENLQGFLEQLSKATDIPIVSYQNIKENHDTICHVLYISSINLQSTQFYSYTHPPTFSIFPI